MAFLSDSYPTWQQRIKLMRQSAWKDANINEIKIDRWLNNFQGIHQPIENERKLACHLLHQFIYFGKTEINECMRVLFRDHFIYPAVQKIRDITAPAQIEAALENLLTNETCFVGVGNPAESGPGLLYRFRTVNSIPTLNFSNIDKIFYQKPDGTIEAYLPSLKNLIFLDDFCATGDQAVARLADNIIQIRSFAPDLKIRYFLLFATAAGLETLRNSLLFDEVVAAVILDKDYKAFSQDSIFYKESVPGVSKEEAENLCSAYGGSLENAHPLGYKNSQLLIGFEHNIPDNSLPIFWKNIPDWYAILPRSEKK